MFKSGSYTAVLMDVELPDIDGCAVAQQMRDMEMNLKRRRTPIIAATAYAMSEDRAKDRAKCLVAGMDEYISKPLDIKQLEDILEQFVKFKEISSVAI